MEETHICTLNEEEIKTAIDYWLSSEKGYNVKQRPGKTKLPVPVIELTGVVDNTIYAKCELETE